MLSAQHAADPNVYATANDSVARQIEGRLKARSGVGSAHFVGVPSNPPGWSAGKWGEWYPNLLEPDGKLSVAKPKPYWQSG